MWLDRQVPVKLREVGCFFSFVAVPLHAFILLICGHKKSEYRYDVIMAVNHLIAFLIFTDSRQFDQFFLALVHFVVSFPLNFCLLYTFAENASTDEWLPLAVVLRTVVFGTDIVGIRAMVAMLFQYAPWRWLNEEESRVRPVDAEHAASDGG